eukprot:4668530-Pleurochrysis_carterae.AAC.1
MSSETSTHRHAFARPCEGAPGRRDGRAGGGQPFASFCTILGSHGRAQRMDIPHGTVSGAMLLASLSLLKAVGVEARAVAKSLPSDAKKTD